MTGPNNPSAAEQVRALYEQAESRAADAFEELVSKPSFGVLLARSAENVAAISRISSDLADLVLRNLRLAGRADVTRLARQLHRTEDKLERLLQEIEELRDEFARGLTANGPGVAGTGPRPERTRGAANGSGGVTGTDARPGRTRGAAKGASPAETETGSRRTRGTQKPPVEEEAPGAEKDTEPERTRGTS